MNDLWELAVDAPIDSSLTYKSPAGMRLVPGQRVKAPLGRRQVHAVVIAESKQIPEFAIKEIVQVETEFPVLPAHFIKWLQWVSEYYMYPLGSTLALAFPPLARKGRGSTKKSAALANSQADKKHDLSEPQQKAVTELLQMLNGFSAHLLFGVTGSGKTEVYMRVLEEVLKLGKKGLILVPEIALTPQLIGRFVARFGEKVAVLHSQLTGRERTTQWWDMVSGEKEILIGARSALFCPIENLGLIIVDEEHEASFKQEEKLKYHGRDCAVMLAKQVGCPIIMGSATPSLETWKNVKEGKYFLHHLATRVENRAMPEIQIVDMRALTAEKKTDSSHWLSPLLQTAIAETLENKQQVVLFLNRRGAAALVICPNCGFTHKCPNCDINLTLHGKSHLVCHYCDFHQNLTEKCPDCKEGEMTAVGLGTEALENEIQKLFPEARIARADRDEISTREDLEDLIHSMESREVDVLVGTQMIAKGLDFENLHLVGVVLADIGFNIPDFRSTERSFQLITQVSGRSGRHVQEGERRGQVVIQTYNPEHASLAFALAHDFVGFAEQELENRRALLYPPYGRLMSIRVQGNDLAKVELVAKHFAERSKRLKSQTRIYEDVEVLGPAPAPIAKLRGKFRFHLLLKSGSSKTLNNMCKQVLADSKWIQAGVRVLVDVDPLHLL